MNLDKLSKLQRELHAKSQQAVEEVMALQLHYTADLSKRQHLAVLQMTTENISIEVAKLGQRLLDKNYG